MTLHRVRLQRPLLPRLRLMVLSKLILKCVQEFVLWKFRWSSMVILIPPRIANGSYRAVERRARELPERFPEMVTVVPGTFLLMRIRRHNRIEPISLKGGLTRTPSTRSMAHSRRRGNSTIIQFILWSSRLWRDIIVPSWRMDKRPRARHIR